MSRNIACILLAAGRSSRMGGANKLLLKINGESMVQRTAREIDQVGFAETIFVTGHQTELVTTEVEEFSGLKVFNPDFATGMHSSIRAALNVLHEDIDAFFICLADQPDFSHQVLNRMICFYESSSDRDAIIYPSFEGKRGHPVLISTHYKKEILLEPDGDYGCAYLFKRHADKVKEIAVDTDDILKDIDEPADYVAYKENHVL